MRLVVDTNVVVAALISAHAPPARILRLVLQRELTALHDDRILAEYRAVLSRRKIGFASNEIRAVIEGIEWAGETVFARPMTLELPDMDDLPFLEVAAAGGADTLVTGNPRHYRPGRGKHSVNVLTPGEFVERLSLAR